MKPVHGTVKLIDDELLTRLSQQAAHAPRKRLNHNLHPLLEDPIQRLCNAFEPGTYVRPHRHPQEERWELFLALRGRLAVMILDEEGTLLERVEIDGNGPIRAIEVPPGAWHSVVSLASGSVVFEVKPGPYLALTDKDFASWAPREGDALAPELVRWLACARPGERFSLPLEEGL